MRLRLLLTALIILVLASIGSHAVNAATGINEQINYQARLLDDTGAVVPDGSYHLRFKIYQDGNGDLGGGDETLKWTETRTTGDLVEVKNGYFSVSLGSVTAFGSNVDWNQDTLWLSIEVGGTGGSPAWDGEMDPFRRLAAATYALNSKQLGGLDWSKFVQIAPAAVQADASTLSTIFLNKTNGTGNILQLQKSGVDQFVINNTGIVTLATLGSADTSTTICRNSSNQLATCTGGGGGNSFETINAPSGTDPVAESATDTLNLTITGTNLTLTGTAGTDTLDFDVVESVLAGNGLDANGDALDIGLSGSTLEIVSDDLRVNEDAAFAWLGAHTFSSAIAANGGITFNAASDTVGAFTMAGTIDANTNILTNIGNAGTDFVAGTGALNLAGLLTANNGITIGTGNTLTSNLGVEFTESDTNPSCSAGDYKLYADNSETKLKKCVNGTISDVQGEPDVVYMSDETNTSWADNNTTELWNGGTQPNITPGNTATELLIMASVRISTDPGTQETQPAARIDREIGSTADCGDVNTVGPTFGISDSNNSSFDPISVATATTIFVDSPATTSNVSYTVCTSADSVLSGTNTENQIDFTIFPVNDSADLAEVYPTNDSSLKAGEVVTLDPNLPTGVIRSHKAYDKNVIGIVSTRPALAIGGRDGQGIDGKPIALSGRVPVKVNTQNGDIKKGDILTSSSSPGVAMKATKAGPILGIAMTNYSGEGAGAVDAFVKNGYFNGSNLRELLEQTSVSIDDQSDFGKAALLYFMKQPTTLDKLELSEIVTDRLAAGTEIISGKVLTDQLFVNTVYASTGKDIGVHLSKDGLLTVNNESGQQTITFDSVGNAVFRGELSASSLEILGKATFKDLVIFEKDVHISGDLNADNISLGDDSGGYALIPAGASIVKVKFSKPYVSVPLIHVSLGEGKFATYSYHNITRDGFEIHLSKEATENLKFSWTATTIKNPRTSTDSDRPTD